MTSWTSNCSKSPIQRPTRVDPKSAGYPGAEIIRNESERTSLRRWGFQRSYAEPAAVALRPAKACGKEGERGDEDNDSGGHDEDSRIGFQPVSTTYLFNILTPFGSDALR